MTPRRQAWTSAAVIAALLGSATVVQVARDRLQASTPAENRLLYIRSGEVLKRVALSYDALLADVYWIRALQHYGRERLKEHGEPSYELLYPMLDMATTLDPLFTVGYRFGALFLAEPHPGGAGRPDLAIQLLEKGIAASPDKWDYYHDVGFIYYWNLHDYRRAAEWFGRGAGLTGAPWWLKTYAAVMLARGGDRQASRFMWQQLAQSPDSAWLRDTAALRLMQLDALDQIDQLEHIIWEATPRMGRRTAAWEELIAAGTLRAVPIDPAGTPYLLDADTGRVFVDTTSRLYPLPTEPAAAPELGAGAVG